MKNVQTLRDLLGMLLQGRKFTEMDYACVRDAMKSLSKREIKIIG